MKSLVVGVRPSRLKESQPVWRHALGETAMMLVGEEEVSCCIPRIVEGLTSMGISPGDKAVCGELRTGEGKYYEL